jgi:putative flippase GtrA
VNQNSHKSSLQFVRYLLVGGFNTVFGYGLFALLNWALSGLGASSYLLAGFLTSLIALSVAFLGYKWFVFRTRGNYLVEYIRAFGVYGSSMIFSLTGLSILVPILRHHLHKPEMAPYIAAAILTVINVLFGFLGHKHFSFRRKAAKKADSSPETPST